MDINPTPERGDNAQWVESNGNTDERKENRDIERQGETLLDPICVLRCHFDPKDAIGVVDGGRPEIECNDLGDIEEKADPGQKDPWLEEARVFLQKFFLNLKIFLPSWHPG